MIRPARTLCAIPLILAALAACSLDGGQAGPTGSAPPTAAPPTAATPTGAPPGSPTTTPTSVEDALAAQLAACETNLKTELAGQVIYPRSLEAAKGVGTSYQAAIDISGNPAPPDVQIDAPSATTAPITVECVVGARLTAVGDLEVSAPDGDTEGSWSYQGFPASGVIEWSWTVTPRTTGHYSLRLELRPAAAAANGSYRSLGSNARISFTTEVNAVGAPIDGPIEWWAAYWPAVSGILVTIGGLLGVAYLWAIRQVPGFKERVDSIVRPSARSQDAGGAAANPADDDVKGPSPGPPG